MQKETIFYIINEINEELSLSNSPRQICNLVLNVLAKVLDVNAGWVRLEDAASQTELLIVTRGLTDAQAREVQGPGLKNVLDDCIDTMAPVIIPDISKDASLDSTSLGKSGFGCLVIVPMVTFEVRGMLGTMWQSAKGFDTDYAYLLMVIGKLVGSALERATLYERLAGPAEPEARTRYDIEEFEKLVALAERYSRATRLAIKEAVVRAKNNEGVISPSLAAFGEGMDLVLPVEVSGKGNGGTDRPAAAKMPCGMTPGREDAAGPGERLPHSVDAGTDVEDVPDTEDPLALHERRMKAFVRLHPGH